MTKTKYYIYALTHPRNKSVRYIGMTTDYISRERTHRYEKGNPEKYQWAMDLREKNLYPKLRVLEETSDLFKAKLIEYQKIEYYNKKRKLFNTAILNAGRFATHWQMEK